MKIEHPFHWLSLTAQRRTFVWLTVLTLVVMGCLGKLGAPLRTADAPQGILSFELAGTNEKADRILASWPVATGVYAGLSLGLDYLFLFLYASAIALGCGLLSQHAQGFWRTLGASLAWGQWIAAGLDAIENYALIQLLMGAQAAVWPSLARYCALVKFALVALGLLFVLGASLFRLWQRWNTSLATKKVVER